jgi:adenylate cyclase
MANSTLYRLRRFMRAIPKPPRCKLCNVPFAGVGKAFRLAGLGPSRKNPNMCTACFEKAPVGGGEVEIGVFFADVRGYTTISERVTAEESARLLAPFYKSARDVLLRHDAVIDKLVGDEVMALFIPLFAGPGAIEKMVTAGVELLAEVGPELPIGAGADFGMAYVGNVGEEDVKDFTALGDVVNTAARLQAAARPGQIVISERLCARFSGLPAEARTTELELKGKSEPEPARVIDLSAQTASVA